MKKTMSLFSANLLFAVTMLLVSTCGSLIQTVSLSWGRTATEVLLIALPTLLFLSNCRVSLQDGLRLGPTSLRTGFPCVVLGMATYRFGLLIEGVMAQLNVLLSASIPSALVLRTKPDLAHRLGCSAA